MLKVYIYVDGSDLDEVSGQLIECFTNFLRTWGVPSARLVNDRLPRTADLRDDDISEWNLGLNFESTGLSPSEFDRLFSFLSQTAAASEREFVVGGYASSPQASEDWAFIGPYVEPSKLEFLRRLFVTD